MLQETLLRAQERASSQQQGAGSQEVEQTDRPQPIPPASAQLADGQPHQRTGMSSPDFEPFEVIEEGDEGEGGREGGREV